MLQRSLAQDRWWQSHFKPYRFSEGLGEPIELDYVSKHGDVAIKIKQSNQGMQEFHSGITQLALALSQGPNIKKACLVFVSTKISADRVLQDWERICSLFTKKIADRLSLIAFIHGKRFVEVQDPFLNKITEVIEKSLENENQSKTQKLMTIPGSRGIEIVKVLLSRWLMQETSISIGKLVEIVGCSYPTVREVLNDLDKEGYLIRKGRSVELSRFPTQSWKAIQHANRQTMTFADDSGTRSDPIKLLNRLTRIQTIGVAIGGVVAARHWDHHFDLNGIPRLDIMVHAPDGYVDLSFLRSLDPALHETTHDKQSASVVIHPIHRASTLFTKWPGELEVTDPVETTLDLLDMGLTQQAHDLLHRLRNEVRLA